MIEKTATIVDVFFNILSMQLRFTLYVLWYSVIDDWLEDRVRVNSRFTNDYFRY